jgi:transposase
VNKNKQRTKRATVLSKSLRLSRSQLRADAILMLSRGKSAAEVAALLGVSRQTVYNWINRVTSRVNEDLPIRLSDAERSGRPKIADGKIDHWISKVIDFPPSSYGYHATEWTAELLRIYLLDAHGIECSRNTVRRSISRLLLTWKRSRYELAPRSPTWRQAKGG